MSMLKPMLAAIAFLAVMLAIPRVTLACPPGMVLVDSYCIDRYEASLGQNSTAVSIAGVLPQVDISQLNASIACMAAGKRLCTDSEWLRACKGSNDFVYPYGNTLTPGQCNDQGSISTTGAYPGCVTAEGAYDMVGNVGEWTADPTGTFRGGYFNDIAINGLGCNYRTTAHDVSYFDDRTGFRCCSDDIGSPPSLSCVGFEPPMDKSVSVKQKNRVLPMKMELFDAFGATITNLDINTAPIVEVVFSGGTPATVPPDAYLPAGQGDEGNKFTFTGTNWHFNLQTKNFSGAGIYTIRAVSGNPSEYVINPMCQSVFIINE